MGKAEKKAAKAARKAKKAERRALRVAEMNREADRLQDQIRHAQADGNTHAIPKLRVQLLILKLRLSTRKWRIKPKKLKREDRIKA